MNADKELKDSDINSSSPVVYIVALVLVIGLVTASAARAQQDVPALVVGFSGPTPMAFDQIYQAEAAGIVSATLSYNGQPRGSICGHVGPDRQSLNPDNRATAAVMLASASIQCRLGDGCAPAGIYVPESSMSMPVSEGQFWTVAGCGGSGASRVYFHSLTVELR